MAEWLLAKAEWLGDAGVPARLKPRELLPDHGKLVRDARLELRLSVAEFGELIHYGTSTARGLETQESGFGRNSIVSRCEQAAEENAEPIASVMRRLARELRRLFDEQSTRIDVQRGTDKRTSRTQPILGDANEIAGDWFAVWQTVRDGRILEIFETVTVTLGRSRGTFEIGNRSDGRSDLRNPLNGGENDGGREQPEHFLWQGTGRCFEQWVSGCFASLPSEPPVAGAFHLKQEYFNFAKVMVGRWMGVSHDSEHTHAVLVMAQSERSARTLFETECNDGVILPLLRGQSINGGDDAKRSGVRRMQGQQKESKK